MAPADRYGYALLPQQDVSEAGGPVAPLQEEVVRHNDSDIDEDGEPRNRQVKYDGGRRYSASTEPWTIHPYNKKVLGWYMLLSCILAGDIIYLPVETAFKNDLPEALVFWADLTSTLLFALDIVLQFFLQIPSPSGDYWVFNHRKIVLSYLKGSFTIDVLSIFPARHIKHITGRTMHGTHYMTRTLLLVKVLRFAKLLRMMRLQRILRRYMYDVSFTYMQRAMGYSLGIMLISIHFIACMWVMLGKSQEGSTWVTVLNKNMEKLGVAGRADKSPLEMYIAASYFALYTLTGIGYGDISPTTEPEYILLTGIMLIGSIIWAAIIGEIVGVLRNANVDEANHQQTMDQLLKISKEFNFSKDLNFRLQAFFSQARETVREKFINDQIIRPASSALAQEVVKVLHGGWMQEVWWLKNVYNTNFIIDLALSFEPMLFSPNECITSSDRLFVIQRGLCVHGSQLLCRDKVWGVDMLLSQDHLRSTLVSFAISYLHVLYLTRERLQETLEGFPREKELVRRAYRVLCLMRGVVWKAKQMKMQEAGQKQESGGLLNSLTHAHGVRRGSSFFRPSQALVSKATPAQTLAAINEVRETLTNLETTMNQRMDAVEGQVQEAVRAISTFIARRPGGHRIATK